MDIRVETIRHHDIPRLHTENLAVRAAQDHVKLFIVSQTQILQ